MPATILEVWNSTARSSPGARALIDATREKTWNRRELDALAKKWAAATAGSVAGETVVFAESNGPGWLEVFLGSLMSGAVPAALDPGEPAEAQRAIAEKIGARFLWSSGRLDRIGGGRRRRRDGRRILKLTSGSTGEPRALPFTDAQMLADGRQICATMGIRFDDVNLGLIPFGHSYGLGNLVLPLIAQGTAVVCGLSALPQAVAAAIEQWRPTIFPAVPALLRALAEADVDPRKIRSLRTVISAGSILPAEVAEAFYRRFGLKIHSFYGSSETGGIAYDRTGDAALNGRGVGMPLQGVRLAFGRGRRFTVESPAVFTLGNRRAGRTHGIHLPADFAQLTARRELMLLGRSGRLIKIGGRRLSPAEIEQALRKLPGIRDAFAAPHPRRPDVLAAAVAGTTSADAVRAALRGRMAPWKIPRKIIVLEQFPLTARGKPDNRRLLELLES
jgi:acyl-CoA synthetase (AMP-forming)/AMP-acid ligase II